MAENKRSFLLYTDLIHVFDKLSDIEAGKLIKHLLAYVNDQNPEPPDRITEIVFEPIKHHLKRDLVRYESIIEKRSQAGKLGGKKSGETRKKKQKQANEASASIDKQNEANEAVSVSVNDIYSKKKRCFDFFWEKYPKKVAKEKCFKKFMDLSNADIKIIYTTIEKYISYKPFAEYTHPNPETFLNQRRWDDPIPEEQTVNQVLGYTPQIPN